MKNLTYAKNTAQGYTLCDELYSDLLHLNTMLVDDLGNDFNCKLWSGYSEVFKYIHDGSSVKASPDYTARTINKADTSYVEVLYGMFESYMRDQGTLRISKKKYMETCKWLIVYLHKMVNHKNIGVLYTRSSNFKSEFNVCNKDFSIPVCISLIGMLKEYKLILDFTGNTLHGSRHMSMLIPSPELLKILNIDGKTYEVTTKPKDLVTLVSDDGEIIPIDEETINIVEDSVHVLGEFVAGMSNRYITVGGYPLPEYWIKRIMRVDKLENSRLFDNGTVQCKSKILRSTIEIDEETTISLDFKSIHPAILLYMEGYKLTDHDPYPAIKDIKVDKKLVNKFKKFYNIEQYDPVRNLVKRLFLCMINADSINKAVGSCYDDLHKDNLKRGTFNESSMKYIGLPSIDLTDIANKLLEHNHMIRHHLGTGIGNKLQYKDSMIMLKCLKVLTEMDIPCLPVHDALICKGSDKVVVHDVMREAFIKVVGEGSEHNCIIEEE
jgi:hypothetical protein